MRAKLLAAAATASVVLLATPAGADAAARPAWSSAKSGVAGVEAHGNYSRTGSKVHFYGTLTDTGGDKMYAKLLVRFTGECCAHAVINKKGYKKSVKIDLVSSKAPHVEVKEVRQNTFGAKEGKWVRIY